MNIALFGGTFDPVHRGHLAVARAAVERFDLSKVYFVPASMPPHRQDEPIAAFHHRYAMLALATAGEKKLLPSLAEASGDEDHLSYTIHTVQRFKQELRASDHLYCITGIDAFMEVSKWHQAERLLGEVDFIVASRPGYSLADVADALPKAIRPTEAVIKAFKKQPAAGTIALKGTTLHLLEEVEERVSATQVRAAAAKKRRLERMVGPLVEEYIRKMGLYVPR